MQAVVHRWHERGRQGCGQPEHWLWRLHHHLRRWVVARVLSCWPERQHDWHFGLCAWPGRQDLPGAHLWRFDRQGQCHGLLHQVQTPRSHKRRCPSGCHSIWDEHPSGGLSRSRCASRTTCPPSAVSTGTVVRSSGMSARVRNPSSEHPHPRVQPTVAVMHISPPKAADGAPAARPPSGGGPSGLLSPVGSAHDFDRTVLVAERKSDAATLRRQRRVPVRAVLLCRSTDAALIALFGADRVALQPGREDVDGRRGVRMSLPGSILARMTRFDGQDLSDSEFRECDLTRARLIGVVVQDAVIDGLVTNLMVNGVEVSSYVEAELDRRHPVRLLIRSADPADLAEAFRQLRGGWAATLGRLRRMPEGCEHERVGGEWSAVETLRHLVFVHDSWFRRCCLGSTKPFTAIGLASAFVPDQEEQGLDPAATPSLDEVLAVRDVQGAELRRWLSTVTPDALSAPAPVPAGRGWPPYARGKSVLECVHVVLDEEWAHHGFCVRDLDLLGSLPPDAVS